MPEGNPLVAAPVETTTAVTGIGIAESCVDLAHGVSNGDWVESGLGLLGAGLEVLSMVIDPLGTLASYGVSWLIEHVRPLKEALDWFAGDPPVIRSFSETWANVAGEVNKVAQDLQTEANSGTAGWTGAAADAYRRHTAETADAVAGAGTLADGISAGVMIMGEVVAFVREFVRDMVGELVGRLISWALEVAATLGLATPLVVAQATAAISKVVNKVADLCRKLVKTIGNVAPRIRKIIDKLDEIIQKLTKLLRGGNSPDAPHTPTSAARHADDAPTLPSSSTTPSGAHAPDTTTPSGTHAPDTTRTPDGTTTPNGTTTSPNGTTGTTSPTRTDSPGMRDNAGDPHADGRQRQCAPGSGDPVDLTTGQMFMGQVDVDLPGVLPLVIGRTHFSEYRVGRWFGRSWSSTVDQRLEVDGDAVYFADQDGARLRYPVPGAGEVLPSTGPRWPLTRAGDGGFTVSQPELGRTLHFPAGTTTVRPISAIRDRNGNAIEFDYDAAGTLLGLRHSGGYRIAVDTTDGLITALRLADVVLVRYRYDERRHLVDVINSSNLALRFDYDHAGRITRWQDRNGEWYSYVYDERGRVVRTEGSGGALTGTWLYDEENRVTVYTNALGHASTYHYNEAYQIVREINPLGQLTTQEWDGYARLAARTDPLGRTTRYAYDDAGRPIAITRPDGTQELAEYNETGRPVTVVGPDGGVWRYEYDERGNRMRTVDPAGAVTRFSYDEHGHLVSATDPLGNVRMVENNPAGLPVAITDPLGRTTRNTRDQFGRLTTITDALGAVTRFRWTVEGQLLARTDATGATEQWRYDGEGNQLEYVDPDGHVTRTATTHFDLPSVRVEPGGARWEYRYDAELRLVAVTNPRGATWRYEYDPAGNLVREKDFNGRELSYAHDPAGQLIRRTNGAGESVEYVRDAIGNVTEQRSGARVSRFEFDPAGRMTRAVNDDADVVFTRDELGRVLAESVNGRTLTSAFDLAGRRIYRRTPTGVESRWSYDGGHRPTALSTAGHALTFRHNAAGLETERLLDESVILTQAWDPAYRLTAQGRRRYHYRRDGHVTSIEDSAAGDRRLELDPAGRVLSVTGPQWTERYTYDPAGTVVAAGHVHHEHDSQGRMVLRQRRTLSGRTMTWRYSWDSEDRLVGVTTPDGARWRYRYDALGRRVAKQQLGADGAEVLAQVEFTWDATTLAEQVDSSGQAMSWDYEPRGHRPATQVQRVLNGSQEWVDQEFYSIVTDLVGAPAELVDAAGSTVWRSARSLWGEAAGPLGPTPLRFPGQYFDQETGLHYNFQRYYDPLAGRYASCDPLGLSGGPVPDGYVDNPLHRIDPLGLTTGCIDPPTRPADSPHYSVAFETELDPSHYPGRSENFHFSEANRRLHQAFQSDPAFARAMEEMYPGIVDGVAPGPRGGFPRRGPIPGVDGEPPPLTWHHHPDRPGVMQLIPYEHHRAPGPVQGSLHPDGRGGMENWGGGRRR
jgi:RHS repeat-associated protein